MIGIREYSDLGDGEHFPVLKPAAVFPAPSPLRAFHWDAVPRPPPRTSEDIISCPLCYDPVIEATASSCGHIFCFDCIRAWARIKNWCPVCQESLTSVLGFSKLHRLYAIDTITENHLREFPPDVQQRFLRRRAVRLAEARKYLKSKHPIKHVNRFRRELGLHFRSKGKLLGIAHPFLLLWRTAIAMIRNVPITLRIVLLLLFAYGHGQLTCNLTPFHFLMYLLNAIWNYPGVKPMSVQPPPPPPPSPLPCERKSLNGLLEKFWPY